jgi:hypothetical protein
LLELFHEGPSLLERLELTFELRVTLLELAHVITRGRRVDSNNQAARGKKDARGAYKNYRDEFSHATRLLVYFGLFVRSQ